MSEAKYKKAAQIISSAGGTPIPVSDTLISILKHAVSEDDLDFILSFRRKKSQTLEELKKSSKLPEDKIIEKATNLAKKGVMFNQPNRHGLMVYRILPFVNVGLFEYFFMKKLEYNQENKELANLFLKLQTELRNFVQKEYDKVVPMLLKQPPIDRTIPFYTNEATGNHIEIKVDHELEVPSEQILPSQTVEELINKFDDIAVGHCFCRHHKDLLGEPCKQTDQRENCFTFGKSARHVSKSGFGRVISKEEALKILREAENDDLVHKAYHPNFDIKRDETSICNCCTCCCGQAPQNLISATINATNYKASINQDLCVGCETCVKHCHTGVIELNDDNKAEIVGEYCIGCGTCAHHCPENAISLIKGQRIVRIPPPRRN
jgi:Pyruvate/2-oxoacid:ferredoxin oxidoreductase delta subunit